MHFASFEQLEVGGDAVSHPTAELWSLNISINHQASHLAVVLDMMPLIVIPSRLLGTTEVKSFQMQYPKHDYIELPDHFDARVPSFGSPRDTARQARGHLNKGGGVVVLERTSRPSGFLPALLMMLADPRVHIEKVIYPIRHAGYELHSDQIGFLRGAADWIGNADILMMENG